MNETIVNVVFCIGVLASTAAAIIILVVIAGGRPR